MVTPLEHIELLKSRFTPTKAAEYLKLTYKTLAQYRYWGTGPHYEKLGKRIVYYQKDLDQWLWEQRVGGKQVKALRGKEAIWPINRIACIYPEIFPNNLFCK
jgi:hypothetical protein